MTHHERLFVKQGAHQGCSWTSDNLKLGLCLVAKEVAMGWVYPCQGHGQCSPNVDGIRSVTHEHLPSGIDSGIVLLDDS